MCKFSVLTVSIGTSTAFSCPRPIGIFPLHLRTQRRSDCSCNSTERHCHTDQKADFNFSIIFFIINLTFNSINYIMG